MQSNTTNTDSSRLIICRAAAGSGKTYTLVRQYLELAFSAPESQVAQRFTHILAITFTNKAANEMKERILNDLEEIIAEDNKCSMRDDLAQRLNMPLSTLRRYAAIVRQSILHNYSDLAVCTIDSFMHRIVRTFAHDLNLPLNFDVARERDLLIQNAVDSLMSLAGTEGQEELTDMLCEYAQNNMMEGNGYMFESRLAKLAEELFKDQAIDFLESLRNLDTERFRTIQRQMAAANQRYLEQLRPLGEEALAIISNAGLSVEDFYQGNKGAGAFFRHLAEGSTNEPNSYARAFLEGDKLGAGKCPPATLDALKAAKPQLQDVYLRFKQLYDSEGKLYNSRNLLLQNIYPLALLNKLGELVEDYSRDNELVHISEFNRRIADIVREEPAPFIYERLGNRYWNYLIDEFQDTSNMQWLNLVPLVENSIATGHTSLVVGDGKQAIYRFRQGDVDQFVSLPHVDSPLHGHILEQPGMSQTLHLDRNFRTGRTIVEFNNALFEWIIRNRFDDNQGLKDIYLGNGERADLAQTPVHEGGYLQLGFWSLDKDLEPLWQEILNDIHHQVDDLHYNYRDITLLARNRSILSKISAFLTKNGIPVISDESFHLTQSQVVMLLRSMLQYLNDGSDRVAAARVLIYLHNLGIVRNDLSSKFIYNPASPTPSLDSLLSHEGLPLRCDRLRKMGLYDCCEEALRMLRLDGIETAYSASFLNVVAKYCTNHRQSLAEFIEWFDEQKDSLTTSTANDLDAVKLMTIHKAKGLQAPIIIYPIVAEQRKQDNIWVHIDPKNELPLPTGLIHPKKDQHTIFDAESNAELSKSDMDRVNILYVALTRPCEKLLVYCQQAKKSGTTDYASLLQDYLSTRTDTVEVRPNVRALGNDSHKQQADEKASSSLNIQLQTLSYPDWMPRIAIAEQSAALFGELDETALRRGNQLHDLLAQLHHRDEADKVLDNYLLQHPLPDDEAAILRDTLHNMMRQPEIARFFDPAYRCINETDLVWQGEVMRPDRIVFTPTETWVVDFKSGALSNKHRIQVSHYCQAIAALTHTDNVKGYLLYLGPDRSQVLPCE